KVSVQAAAPSNTKYVTLILYSNVTNTGSGYFDNAVLYDVTQAPRDSAAQIESVPSGAIIGFRPAEGSRVSVNPPPFIWPPVASARSYVVEYSARHDFIQEATYRIDNIELPLL